MSNEYGSWARHYQEAWHSRAGDERLPHWLRVAALAYGSHTENGHARFKRGEVALVLARVEKGTGVIRPYANVRRAIGEAIDYGWLVDGSYWGCLIVPAHAIRKGSLTTVKACPLSRTHTAKRSLSERKGTLKPTLSERFEGQSVHSVSGSEREPSCLSVPPTPWDLDGSLGRLA